MWISIGRSIDVRSLPHYRWPVANRWPAHFRIQIQRPKYACVKLGTLTINGVKNERSVKREKVIVIQRVSGSLIWLSAKTYYFGLFAICMCKKNECFLLLLINHQTLKIHFKSHLIFQITQLLFKLLISAY